ncbi:MAG: conjugative transposon protein TraM [Paludibacteraceae bacterium]|nr:conjugative transposon protein TraM [Paludibacteraceae bacterium]
MSNKTLATHLYCLFIFVAGCLGFWLFGGGEEPENNHVDNKEEIVAQPAAEKLAVVEDAQEQRKNIGENDSVYQSTELQENVFISSTVEGDAEVDLSDSKTNSKRRDTKKQVEQDLKECESTIPSSTSNIEKNAGFHRMGESNDKKSDNLINAVIHERLKNINEESQIKLRLMDEVTVEGVSIPKNTVVFATARLSADRVYLTTETVTYKKKDYPFNADVYDLDGMEGLDMTDKNMVLPAGYKVMIRKK